MSNNEPPVSAQVLLQRTKCYKVVLSTKVEVRCDQSELHRVVHGIKTSQIIKLKQGLINPSFIVAVLSDEERRLKFVDEVHSIEQHNSQDREYHGGNGQRRLPSGMKSLRDIFAGTPLKALPPSDVKSLPKPK